MSKSTHEASHRWRDDAFLRKAFWPAVWFGLFLLAFATWRLYWEVRLMQQIGAMQAVGMPVSKEELEAAYREPEGEKASDDWIKATKVWKENPAVWLPSKQDSYGEEGTDFPPLGLRYPDDIIAKIKLYFDTNEEAFGWMEKASQKQRRGWPMKFSEQGKLEGLGREFDFVCFLRERMRVFGVAGKWNDCCASLAWGMRLTDDLGSMPLSGGPMYGQIMDTEMLMGFEEQMPFLSYGSGQLKELQGRLSEQRLCRTRWPKIGFDGSGYCLAIQEIEGPTRGGKKDWVKRTVWRALGGEAHDRAKVLAYVLRLRHISISPEPLQWEAAVKAEREWENGLHAWELGCAPEVWGFAKWTIQSHLTNLSRFDAAITALAVERYRLDAGRLPVTLDELVPRYLSAVPVDLYDSGKPLKYKVEADRFSVYSVGEDGRDDGGKESAFTDIPFIILLPHAKRGITQDFPDNFWLKSR